MADPNTKTALLWCVHCGKPVWHHFLKKRKDRCKAIESSKVEHQMSLVFECTCGEERVWGAERL